MPSLVPVSNPNLTDRATSRRMIPRSTTSLAAVLLTSAILATSAAAQSAVTPSVGTLPSVKLLRAAKDADSLRGVTTSQASELERLRRSNRELATAASARQAQVELLRRRLAEADRAARIDSARVDARVAQAGAPAASASLPASKPQPAPAPAAAVPAAVVQPAPAPAPASAPAPAPAPAPTPAPAAPAKVMEIATGRITFSGLVQGWASAGNAGYTNSFRVRRTELKFVGEVTPNAKWTVLVDPSKSMSLTTATTTVNDTTVIRAASVSQGSRLLQDAFISLEYLRGVRIDIGAQKLPLSLEGLQSSAALETIERTLFASDRGRGGAYGDIRDVGASARGTVRARADWHVGVFNGSGESQNDVDRNNGKVYAGRLAIRPPMLTGLQLGASGSWSGQPTSDAPRRERLGAELLYRRGGAHLKSELMTGKDSVTSRRGFYAQAGYRVRPDVELVTRFDSWDPDVEQESSAATSMQRDYIAGVSWQLTGNNVKLQLNHLYRTYSNDVIAPRSLALVNVQTAW